MEGKRNEVACALLHWEGHAGEAGDGSVAVDTRSGRRLKWRRRMAVYFEMRRYLPSSASSEFTCLISDLISSMSPNCTNKSLGVSGTLRLKAYKVW